MATDDEVRAVLERLDPLRTDRHNNEAREACGDVIRHETGEAPGASFAVVRADKAHDALAHLFACRDALVSALADAERTIRGLQRMVSCEDTDRECAGTKPDPPDKILSRCFVCQVAALREDIRRGS